MRELLILWAARHRREAWEGLCADYRTRVRRHVALHDRQIKVRGGGAARRRSEGKALLAALPERCWLIALDPRGKQLSSEALASEMRRLRDEWPHPVVFAIGSDLGLDPEVTSRANQRLSFGPMTFGHELARLMLYEQIYRALSIERGIKYHRPVF